MMKARKIIDFEKNRKYYYTISAIIILFTIVASFVFPPELDIKFTGGAMLKYSYLNEVDADDIAVAVKEATGASVSVDLTSSVTSDNSTSQKKVVISFNDAVNDTIVLQVTSALQTTYPTDTFELLETNSVDKTMGKEFIVKCVVAVVLAVFFMVLYVAFRFKKIGGWSAGVCGIVAIIHDLIVVYMAFVIFGYPLDDNFIAVLLSIIGFSLNDTVVIFDRIRENRKTMGPKTSTVELATTSVIQTLGRTVCTSICVFASVLVVAIVAALYGLDSIITFAVPMLFGVVSGCYSSVFISVSLWVTWTEKAKAKKNTAK